VRPDSLAERMTGSFHPGIAAQIRAEQALKQELNELGAQAGLLIEHSQRSWESATYSGVRHTLIYVFDRGNAVAHGLALLDRLPSYKFSIPHQEVVSADVVEVDLRVSEPERLQLKLQVMVVDKA
jgi:hypothetical protein